MFEVTLDSRAVSPKDCPRKSFTNTTVSVMASSRPFSSGRSAAKLLAALLFALDDGAEASTRILVLVMATSPSRMM